MKGQVQLTWSAFRTLTEARSEFAASSGARPQESLRKAAIDAKERTRRAECLLS